MSVPFGYTPEARGSERCSFASSGRNPRRAIADGLAIWHAVLYERQNVPSVGSTSKRRHSEPNGRSGARPDLCRTVNGVNNATTAFHYALLDHYRSELDDKAVSRQRHLRLQRRRIDRLSNGVLRLRLRSCQLRICSAV